MSNFNLSHDEVKIIYFLTERYRDIATVLDNYIIAQEPVNLYRDGSPWGQIVIDDDVKFYPVDKNFDWTYDEG